MEKLKRFFIPLCVCLIFANAAVVAQEEDAQDPSQVEVIQEQQERNVTMTIEYIPVTDEARITYKCPSGLFDQGAAMNAIKNRASTFTKEKGYYFYTYIKPDVTQFDNAARTTEYTSFIRFLR
jgi:hypothetical protein